jgi:hypothetical protein
MPQVRMLVIAGYYRGKAKQNPEADSFHQNLCWHHSSGVAEHIVSHHSHADGPRLNHILIWEL